MTTGPSRRRPRRRRREPMETPEYALMLERMIRRYGVRVGDADELDLAEMLRVREEFDKAVRVAVLAQKARGQSWAEIARGLGVTRQAAQMRFGSTENAGLCREFEPASHTDAARFEPTGSGC